MAAAASSSSSLNQDLKQESQDENELKKDHFGRLPDDVVMLIINKLIHMKTLIRFSLVSKRYFSLVPQTDSLFVDFGFVPRGYLGILGSFLGARFSDLEDTQKLNALTHGFQQVKHLHLHTEDNFASVNPLERWLVAFGSLLKFCNLITASSVNQYSDVNASVASGTEYMHGLLDDGDIEGFFQELKSLSRMVLVWQSYTKELVSECKILETVVISDNYRGSKGTIIMEKGQIALLKENDPKVSFDAPEFHIRIDYVPTLDLPKSGYTMKNAYIVHFTPINQEAKDVEVMCAEAKETSKVSLTDGVSFDDYLELEIFHEAVQKITSENRAPVYVSDRDKEMNND